MRIKASASVTITVEIPMTGAYGLDWSIADLHREVCREAAATLRAKLPDARVVIEPHVKVCTFEIE